MKYTFGRTLAAQRLEILVENTPSARRKISRLLSSYTSNLFLITGAQNPETVRLCMEMLRDYTLRRVDVTKNLTDDMRTYTKNVIVYRYRVYRHTFDELVPAVMKIIGDKKKKNKNLTSGDDMV